MSLVLWAESSSLLGGVVAPLETSVLHLPPATHSLSPAASWVLGGVAVEDIDSAATISSAFACARMQHGYVTGNNGSSIEREGEKRARGYRGGDALVNFQPFHHVCACLYVCVFGGYSWMTEMGGSE